MKNNIFLYFFIIFLISCNTHKIKNEPAAKRIQTPDQYINMNKLGGIDEFALKSHYNLDIWREGLALYDKLPQIVKEKNMQSHHLDKLRFNLIVVLFSPYNYCITLNKVRPTQKEIDFLVDEYVRMGADNNQVNAMILSASDNCITPEKKDFFKNNTKINKIFYDNALELTLKDMANTRTKNTSRIELRKKVVESLNKIKS